MDHSPSIITQVTRDEEENAARRDEGEFVGEGKKFFSTFSAAHDGVSAAARDRAALSLKSPCLTLTLVLSSRGTRMSFGDIVANIFDKL